jgi:hypothetical protein
MSLDEVEKIVEFIHSEKILGELNKGYNYCHASLCLIDAVYSVNSKYDAVEKAIERYSSYYKVLPNRLTSKEDTIQDLHNHISETGPLKFAEEVIKNKTKIKNRLKSEVLLELASYFIEEDIFNLSQLSGWGEKVNPDLFKKESNIFGIGSTTVKYLAMLAGNESLIKPDRHILRFLADVLRRTINDPKEAEILLKETARILKVPARTLDNSIWRYQRSKKRGK